MKALGWSLILLRFFYTGQYNNILKCENTDLICVRGWNSDLLQAGKRAAESAVFAAGWGGACTAVIPDMVPCAQLLQWVTCCQLGGTFCCYCLVFHFVGKILWKLYKIYKGMIIPGFFPVVDLCFKHLSYLVSGKFSIGILRSVFDYQTLPFNALAAK